MSRRVSKTRSICRKICNVAYTRSRLRNIAFNIDTEYLESIYPENHICPILGYEMVPDISGKRGGHKYSPSLDRINPRLGYVKGNVQWVCMLANRMFSDATGEDVIRFAKWAIKRYNIKMENKNDKQNT
jgi:hypothetical protein